MFQQKQQKISRSVTQINKDPSKIGYLLKKHNLPPIETRSSSRSKTYNCLQQFSSPKKIKIPDIYYEQIYQSKPQKNRHSIITEKDSVLQKQQNSNNQKQQTVIKKHQKYKKQENQLHLCNFHQKRVISQLQKQENQQKLLFKQKNRYCCETQPSHQNIPQNSKYKLFTHKYNSLQQSMKQIVSRTPQKLKPIKTNLYQKPQLFGPVSNKLIPAEKNPYHKDYLSKQEQLEIVQKLSKPKCTIHGCGKKNCKCFNESCLSKSVKSISPNNYDLTNCYNQKQIQTKKLKINIDKLKHMNDQQSPEAGDQIYSKSLKKKVNQKKTLRKNHKLKSLHRFDTESFDEERFFRVNKKMNEENQVQCESLSHGQKCLSSSKISSEQESFIKGIITPYKTTIDKDRLIDNFHDRFQRDIGFNAKNRKKVQIEIQTQDILIVKNDESKNKNSTKTIKPMHIGKQQKNKLKQETLNKQNNFQQDEKDVEHIGYTFGNKKHQILQNQCQKYNQKQQIVEHKKIKKSKQQKIQCLKQKIQYWIHYNVKNNLFIDLLDPRNKDYAVKIQPKINIVSSVVKQSIFIQGTNKQRQTTNQKLKISQISQISHITQNQNNNDNDKLSNIPITIQKQQLKKNQISEQTNNMLSKSRHFISSISGKNPINMFNRSPKSNTSSRIIKCFKIPKQSEYVEFVKTYKPFNPLISMQKLIQSDKFNVIPSLSKFYFGQTIGQSIKHGTGIEITLNQIFQGQYIDGNRVQGYLKLHDGVYNGPFQNNLRHGYGNFKWDNGQFFQGYWKMGTKNGYGKWICPDGSSYQGEWHLNMQHGKGKHIHPTGVYEGDFVNFRKQGFGKQTHSNGDVFAGEYKNGKPNGKGKYQWKNGTYYQGNFVQGLREGFGKWHQNANVYYEGEFLKDQKHGSGNQYYKDGSYFKGYFNNGNAIKGQIYDCKKQLIKVVEEQKQQNS